MPLPTSSWRATLQYPRPNGTGLLGPKPQPYHAAAFSSAGYTQTDIEAVMHALAFSQLDGNFYMDTGATSHMTADPSIFSSYFNSIDNNDNIVVVVALLFLLLGTVALICLHHTLLYLK